MTGPAGAGTPGWLGPARLAVAADLLLAALLTFFLFVATDRGGDVIPRPLVIGVLFATPGVIGLFGIIGQRRSLLAAAAWPLLPGSLLSFSLVTLVFVIPALLFIAAVISMPSPGRPLRETLVSVGRAVLVGGLVVAAVFAVLIGMTTEGCYAIPNGSGCGSGQISWAGLVTAGVLLTAAIAISTWTVRARLRG